jgi:SAM-dependent methyltransferase
MDAPKTTAVFDDFSKNYEKQHDHYLPPGVESRTFMEQKVQVVAQYIKEKYPKDYPLKILDFGSNNGRLAYLLLKTLPQISYYHGVDESTVALDEARKNLELFSIRKEFSTVIPKDSFDFVLALNVFHHVEPALRKTVALALTQSIAPGGSLWVWEHNPYNPITLALVKWCPFDQGVKLLFRQEVETLFSGLKKTRGQYTNITPPTWCLVPGLKWLEEKFNCWPFGAQYFAVFEKNTNEES